MRQGLREAMREKVLVGDGAMGTYLYQLGFPVGISYEELNIERPDVIRNVHLQYYDAGARVIETNTFSASREKLSKYGLEHEIERINRSAVDIARDAVGTDAFVLGAVGSIRAGKRKNYRTTIVRQDLEQQIGILLDCDIDGILLETFFDLEEMLIALRYARKHSDIPIICQFAVEDAGRTLDGFTLNEAFYQLEQDGADVVGFNCRSGPSGILRAMEQTDATKRMPFSVFPNAGIPDYVDGRYQYMATPEYFADNALRFADMGARLIGGCCGTTPDHIKAMSEALADYIPETTVSSSEKQPMSYVKRDPHSPEKTKIVEKAEESILDLVAKRHTVIVELDPPRDLEIDKFMEGTKVLHQAGADAITLADNSLAVTRMSNMALGKLMKDQFGVRPLIHIACRDRNLIGTQSHMMGLHTLGINHVLAVTGDPARFGDLPGASSVYDLTSFEMIRMIKQLNEGIAFSGKPLKKKANFVVGAAFNPNVKHLDKAVKRLERKIEAGADYIMTQPVYEPALIEDVYEATKHLDIPIFIGICPLASGRNAEYLHNEVPGIQLTDQVLKRMEGLKGAEGKAMGVAISKELLDVALHYFRGIYLMTPFLAYEMTAELTRYVWEQSKKTNSYLYMESK